MTAKNIQIIGPDNETITLKDFIEWYYTEFIGKKKVESKDHGRVKQAMHSLQANTVISRDALRKHVYDELERIESQIGERPPIR